MTVRRKVVLLLAFIGLYGVLVAAAAVFGSDLRVRRAAEEFRQIAGQTTRIEELEFYLTEQEFLLQQVVDRQDGAVEAYSAARRKWTHALHQCIAFGSQLSDVGPWEELADQAAEFDQALNGILTQLEQDRHADAQARLQDLVARVVPELRERLSSLRSDLADARADSARVLAHRSSQVVILTIAITLFAGVVVAVGAFLVRRWLIRPLDHLQRVTGSFRAGDLNVRSSLPDKDEFGQLGAALNEMAEALACSQSKHHTLFSNLRDAVVLCDRAGVIVEYHDGDTKILGVAEDQHVGRALLDVWPEWATVVRDWDAVIASAVDDGRQISVNDVQLNVSASERSAKFADFVIYRVDCGSRCYAAVVIRDATQRHKLQDRLRHAETMEAIGTMAGGLAHDVNNLLSGVTGSLSSLVDDLSDPGHKERIDVALQACRRASSLSRRLLNFARGVQGHPQVFNASGVIRTVLSSLEGPSCNGAVIRETLDPSVRIRMDQDQFAEIVVNLIQNAQDACSGGGQIDVRLRVVDTASAYHATEVIPHAALTVKDTGVGMDAVVKNRVFEPFFTTKARAGARGRGLGLTMVYAAAKTAGGFVQIESQPSVGTQVSVYIPVHDTEPAIGPCSNSSAGVRPT